MSPSGSAAREGLVVRPLHPDEGRSAPAPIGVSGEREPAKGALDLLQRRCRAEPEQGQRARPRRHASWPFPRRFTRRRRLGGRALRLAYHPRRETCLNTDEGARPDGLGACERFARRFFSLPARFFGAACTARPGVRLAKGSSFGRARPPGAPEEAPALCRRDRVTAGRRVAHSRRRDCARPAASAQARARGAAPAAPRVRETEERRSTGTCVAMGPCLIMRRANAPGNRALVFSLVRRCGGAAIASTVWSGVCS